ncbi:uncharacterized protein EAE97_001770 [Botrytis byssoidea]|uniref:Endonuclease/exonuclease/phosphatase domain-containing protein n=1 Tax=Botrytis byssoidea TaxID=139641 RepID=A0A9P5IVV0_9HELO|nr:uncharacterized protein EAE97_001770 [Botrytis byssoidea]KAF7952273.1 hypothetical protein EAE97_001770 [Botrytis byssoidea]
MGKCTKEDRGAHCDPTTGVRGRTGGYDCFALLDSWDSLEGPEREAERPRTMTYVRKGKALHAQQKRMRPSRDFLWVEVNGIQILNIYRQPGTRDMIELTKALEYPDGTVIGGDFNAKHELLEPGVTTSDQGALLAEWPAMSGMEFTGAPGVPTHLAGHMIDLTFSNIQFADSIVAAELNSGSDHETQITTISNNR